MQIFCKSLQLKTESLNSIELSWFRAPALQAGGHWFESSSSHEIKLNALRWAFLFYIACIKLTFNVQIQNSTDPIIPCIICK